MLRKCLMAFVVVGLIAGAANAGLVAHWTFDSGTAQNDGGSAGAAADGSLEGGAAIVYDDGIPFLPWNPVKPGSLVLDVGNTAAQAYVNVGGGGGGWGDGPQTEMTMAAWIKWYDPGDDWSNFSTIVSKSGGESTGFSFSRFSRNDDVTFNYISLGGWSGTPSGINVLDGDWHYVVGTWKDGSVTGGMSEVDVYVDGVWTNAASQWRPAGLPINEWDVIIGGNAVDIASGSGYRFWGGLIDAVTIYDEALDAGAVADLFAAHGVPEPATIALLGLGGLALLRRRRKR